MTKEYKQIISDISQYTGELRKVAPDAMNGFYAMAKAATADGALDKKTKEFIALAIGVTQRCDGCIGFHVKALKELELRVNKLPRFYRCVFIWVVALL